MEYKKPVYFTVKAPSLDEEKSFITVVSSAGTIVDWCSFSGLEQTSEEEWRLVFIITKPYYYLRGEESVRYGYVVGILQGEDDGLCKKIRIDDEIKIRQEGCLFESIELVSNNIVALSQGCDSVEFLNVEATVYSNCSDEYINAVSDINITISQECEEVNLLVSYSTILFDDCNGIENASSPDLISNLLSGEIVIDRNCE